MKQATWPTGLPYNFGGLEGEPAEWEHAAIAVVRVPYDFSTS